ncbi:hypothetical protein [Nocardioides sp.]|uniref:hypothetical protein n=1 Tax=Nocardioides sp. TaxID=35761 RepID=UPI0035AE4F84
MAEQTTPLAATIDAFDSVRGDDMDGVWAFGVSWSLMMRDVDPDLIRDGLEQALAVVRTSGESPSALFGDASQHAAALYDEWSSEGRLTLIALTRTTWPEALRLGTVLSAAYAVLFAVVQLVRGDLDASSGARILLISLVIGMGSGLGLAVWSRRHRRSAPPADLPADLRWSAELTEILRTDYSLSGSRVRDIVAEASAHVAESGRSMSDEFGTPREYAARFAPDLARRSLFTAAFLGALSLLNVIPLVDEPHWSNVGLLLGFGWLAVAEHRKYRHLRAG